MSIQTRNDTDEQQQQASGIIDKLDLGRIFSVTL